ncbi:MAG: YaeQ family protein [Candidatus Eisenbacteria bacterium]
MALNATVFKAELNVADMDRHYYADHSLTVARHPSETDERMMVRLLAFALHAHERLEFGRGIGAADLEADLWLRDLTGRVDTWIDVGLPDEKRVLKACGQSEHVIVYAYGGRSAELWWSKARAELERSRNLTVYALARETCDAITAMVEPRMELQLLVQEGELWLACGDARVSVVRETWRAEPA